jgi:hypothetical protein
MRFRAVSAQRLPSAVESERDAGAHVREEGDGYEEGFCEAGLVVWPCEEEVAVAFGDGSGEEGYKRRIGDVEGGEDGKGVGGVFLDARNWRLLVYPFYRGG